MITLLKMAKNIGRRFIQAREITIDLFEKKVMIGNREIELSPVEFLLLKYLAMKKGEEVSVEQLLKYLWRKDIFLLEDTIGVIMDNLMSKIEETQFAPRYIININNRLYKFLEGG